MDRHTSPQVMPFMEGVITHHQTGKQILLTWYYHIHCSSDKCQYYNDNKLGLIVKMAEQLWVQLKLQMFDDFNTISILSFLLAFKIPFNTNGIYDGTALCLFHFLIKKRVRAALTARGCQFSSIQVRQESDMTFYCHVINWLIAKNHPTTSLPGPTWTQ